eukprot:UN01756
MSKNGHIVFLNTILGIIPYFWVPSNIISGSIIQNLFQAKSVANKSPSCLLYFGFCIFPSNFLISTHYIYLICGSLAEYSMILKILWNEKYGFSSFSNTFIAFLVPGTSSFQIQKLP